MKRMILKIGNTLFSLVILSVVALVGLYSVYAIWDNYRIYAEAKNIQDDLISLKPDIENGASFEELLKINPDVIGWVSLDNTEIDYPVLQGETNMTYINMDVYGNFSLSGSIFLDTRNESDFSDPYSLLYGHHMADHRMFGDLDLYKEEEFFYENTSGQLIVPGGYYDLEILSVIVTTASEDLFFDPDIWKTGDYMEEIRELSLYVSDSYPETNPGRLLAFSTCDSDYTNARTIVLTVIKDYHEAG